MNTPLDPSEFTRLSVPERLDLIGQIWDSIEEDDTVNTIPEWHRAELERRRAEANPEAGIPWDDFEACLADRS